MQFECSWRRTLFNVLLLSCLIAVSQLWYLAPTVLVQTPSDFLSRPCPAPAPAVAARESAVPSEVSASASGRIDRRERVVRRVTSYIQEMQSKINDYNNTKYFVYLEARGVGVGNKINALVSSMLFAMASKRVFLVQSSEFLNELTPVFPWNIPNYDQVFTPEQRANKVYLDFECCSMANKTWLDELRYSNRPHVLNLDMGEGTVFNQLCCHDWVKRYESYKFVEFRTNQYMVPFGLYNPHYSELMTGLFETFEPMGVLSKSMLIIEPKIRSLVDAYKKKYEFDKHWMAGVQIRTYLFNRGKLEDPMIKLARFFHCADKAEAIYRERYDDPRPTQVFICSDNQTVIKEMKRIHGPKVVSLGKEDLPPGLSKSEMDNLLRLVDILLVSECDEMVLSDFSTFSTIASGISAKRPYVMLQEGFCIQRVNADPCFTYSWALPYQSCYDRVPAYQRDWGLCQHDYWRKDPWEPKRS